MFEPEPPASHLLKKVFKCVEARDAAHDPEIKVLWEVHAETLRRELRRLLDEMDGGVRR
jgi:hypothetical protein